MDTPALPKFENVYPIPRKEPRLDGVTSWLYDQIDKIDRDMDATEEGKGKIVSWSSGLPSVDSLTNGFQQSQYYVIAGQTGFGKSSFALTTALTLAVASEPSVLFVSLEMSQQDMAIRGISWLTGIAQSKIVQAIAGRIRLSPEERQGISTSKAFVRDRTRMMCGGMLTPEDVRKEAVALQKGNGLSLVIVDYLQLMRGTAKSYATREREVAEVSRSLRSLSLDLNVPVIALSQLSRQANTRNEPLLTDLRESGSLEQDASAVLFLSQVKDERTKHIAPDRVKIAIAKNRFGPKGDRVVRFLGASGRFEDLEVPDDPAPGNAWPSEPGDPE